MITDNLRKIVGNSLGNFENVMVFGEFTMEPKRPKCYNFHWKSQLQKSNQIKYFLNCHT